ncbi:MAG TPA: hypothetical protein VLG91_02050, partial [Streptomyces sp.]|nr:hypothetical protein [Streptomyces sp.]
MRATYLGHVASMTFVQKQLWMGRRRFRPVYSVVKSGCRVVRSPVSELYPAGPKIDLELGGLLGR